MNPTSVFPSLRLRCAAGIAAGPRALLSLVAAALSLPAAGSLLAQAPGTLDTGFAPTTVAANIYAQVFTYFGVNDPRNTILVAGDNTYDENLQPDGAIKGNFVAPTFGATGRIIFDAEPERIAGVFPEKTLLGGLFGEATAGAPAQNITRILFDGTVDTSFNVGSGANYYVTAILPLVSGKVVVGGLFTSFDNTPRLRIVRLNNDGSIDTSFNNSSAIDSDVLALAEGVIPNQTDANGTPTLVPDGTTLVAGDFNHVGGQSVTKLARLDASGNLDPTFKPVIDTRVIAVVVQPTGKIIIGGQFTKVNGTPVSHIARLNRDGSLDTSFTTAVTGLPTGGSAPVAVYVLKQLSYSPTSLGKVYVGGNFTQINGATRRYLGLINPNGTVGAFDPGTTIYDSVQSIVVQPNNGRVLIGETLGPKIGTNYVPPNIRLFGATTTP